MTRIELETMTAIKRMAGAVDRAADSLARLAAAVENLDRTLTPKQEGGQQDDNKEEPQDRRAEMRETARALMDAIRHTRAA